MLFVTDSVQLLQQVLYQGSHWRIWRLQKRWTSNLYCVICRWPCATIWKRSGTTGHDLETHWNCKMVWNRNDCGKN